MELVFAVVLGVVMGLSVVGAGAWLIGRRLRAVEVDIDSTDRRIAEAVGILQQSLTTVGTGHQEALASVSRQLGEVSTAAKQLADQTRRLEEIRDALRVPGPRGGMGELLLENVLRDVLPAEAYSTQYEFSDGSRVDSVVRFADRLIPIDAKFPLTAFTEMSTSENDDELARARRRFVQAVRRHIDAVHDYVRPDDGTTEFALLYVPGESVFYEALRRDRGERLDTPLWQYAQERQVTLVSPNSLYVYLQTIAMAMRGKALERSARVVQDRLALLTRQTTRVLEEFGVLGNHLRNARRKYDDVDEGLRKIHEDLQDQPDIASTLDGPVEE
jgi:DNA recombination protein RmuC